MLPAYPRGGPRRALEADAHELLAQFGLGDKAEYRVEWLSGGEAQRTAICRALINGPRVLIADEPTPTSTPRGRATSCGSSASSRRPGRPCC